MPSEGNNILSVFDYQTNDTKELESILQALPEEAVLEFNRTFIRLHDSDNSHPFVLVDYFTQIVAYHPAKNAASSDKIGDGNRINDRSRLVELVRELKTSRKLGEVHEINTYSAYVEAKAREN